MDRASAKMLQVMPLGCGPATQNTFPPPPERLSLNKTSVGSGDVCCFVGPHHALVLSVRATHPCSKCDKWVASGR